MREIKFRALIGKMDGSVKWIYYEPGSLVLLDDDEKYICKDSEYIGLKDKNDKEIYEGDIIKLANGGNVQIIFSFCMFRVSDGAFTQPLVEAVCPASPDCEVIGNIYENKELLDS